MNILNTANIAMHKYAGMHKAAGSASSIGQDRRSVQPKTNTFTPTLPQASPNGININAPAPMRVVVNGSPAGTWYDPADAVMHRSATSAVDKMNLRMAEDVQKGIFGAGTVDSTGQMTDNSPWTRRLNEAESAAEKNIEDSVSYPNIPRPDCNDPKYRNSAWGRFMHFLGLGPKYKIDNYAKDNRAYNEGMTSYNQEVENKKVTFNDTIRPADAQPLFKSRNDIDIPNTVPTQTVDSSGQVVRGPDVPAYTEDTRDLTLAGADYVRDKQLEYIADQLGVARGSKPYNDLMAFLYNRSQANRAVNYNTELFDDSDASDDIKAVNEGLEDSPIYKNLWLPLWNKQEGSDETQALEGFKLFLNELAANGQQNPYVRQTAWA